MSAFFQLLAIGVAFCGVVSLPFVAVYLVGEWWHSRPEKDEVEKPWEPGPPLTFICKGCGTGPWAIEWDPPEQPGLGRIGGRFCPNCSGAD